MDPDSHFQLFNFSPGKNMDSDPHSSKSLDLDTLKKKDAECGYENTALCTYLPSSGNVSPMLRIWSRIRWIEIFLGHPDPFLRDPDPSII
jgi:hypothetical protein